MVFFVSFYWYPLYSRLFPQYMNVELRWMLHSSIMIGERFVFMLFSGQLRVMQKSKIIMACLAFSSFHRLFVQFPVCFPSMSFPNIIRLWYPKPPNNNGGVSLYACSKERFVCGASIFCLCIYCGTLWVQVFLMYMNLGSWIFLFAKYVFVPFKNNIGWFLLLLFLCSISSYVFFGWSVGMNFFPWEM